jgi:hypothetical protein
MGRAHRAAMAIVKPFAGYQLDVSDLACRGSDGAVGPGACRQEAFPHNDYVISGNLFTMGPFGWGAHDRRSRHQTETDVEMTASCGGERAVRVPIELARFDAMPMAMAIRFPMNAKEGKKSLW